MCPIRTTITQRGNQWSKIVLLVIPSPSSSLEAMQTGEISADSGDCTTVTAARADGYRIWTAPRDNVDLYVNVKQTSAPEFNNLKVRQAMNYAINRKVLASAFGDSNYGDEVFTVDGYTKKYANYYPYDPTRAKQLLAAAGYPNGFSANVVTISTYDDQDAIVAAAASQLAKVGITLIPSPPHRPFRVGPPRLQQRRPRRSGPALRSDFCEHLLRHFLRADRME